MKKFLFIVLCICNLVYACSSDDGEDVDPQPDATKKGTFSLLLKEKVISNYVTPYGAKVWWKSMGSVDIHFVTGGKEIEEAGHRLSFVGDDIVSDTMELGAGSYTIAKLILYNRFGDQVIEYKPTADYSFVLGESEFVQKNYKVPNQGIYSIAKDSLALATLMRVNFGSDMSKWPIDLTKAPNEWKFVEYDKNTKRIVRLCFNAEQKTVADYSAYAIGRKLWEDDPSVEELPSSEGNWGDTGLKIKVIPEEITLMDALKDIDFCGNELEEIPTFIKSLKNLYGLSVAYNKLTSLPEELFEMLRLNLLDVSGNPLTTLPRLGQVSNLEILNASYCKLTSLGDELSNYSNLTHLTVIGNEISSIGNLATVQPKLRTLDIRDNQLKSITKEMVPAGLLGLFADDNQITTLPANWEASGMLDLGLSGNKITDIPSAFLELPKLEYLDLSGNQLSSIPGNIEKCKSLLILDLSDNSLTSLPAEIVQCTALRGLYLMNNTALAWTLPAGMKARYGKCQTYEKNENGEKVWQMGPSGLFVDARGCTQVSDVPEPIRCN